MIRIIDMDRLEIGRATDGLAAIGMAALAGIGTILGLLLLPMASRRKRKNKTP
jgi:hypothetical protein